MDKVLKFAKVSFKEGTTDQEIEDLVDMISQALRDKGITAVIEVGEEQVEDDPA